MKVFETKFTEFLNDGSDRRFVIPIFQRNYDWKTKNCEQLFDDLKSVITEKRQQHFFGCMVTLLIEDNGIGEYQIIDGQQRLTTTTLLFLAMYNLLDQNKIEAGDKLLKERIFEKFLVDKYSLENSPIKECTRLQPIEKDQEAFYNLFNNSTELIKTSNITTNYKYFYDRIQNEKISIDELYRSINSLRIVNIKLEQEDNPQIIFESLNSTGLDLSESDKIRNYLLMSLPYKQQNKYYRDYWIEIEDNVKTSLDKFIYDYLNVKQITSTKSVVYFVFKSYMEAKKLSVKELLSDLLEYARLYKILLGKAEANDPRITACIYRLNGLDQTFVRPFFLEVLRLYTEKKLSQDDTYQIFKYTENFLFRRLICGIPTQGLNKMFQGLHKEIMRFDKNADYLEKFKYVLLCKRESNKFPDDEEFGRKFVEIQWGSKGRNKRVYILERLENFDTNEVKDVISRIENKTYTIEHIMPENLTPQWVSDLGKNYKQIHQKWLNRIANLTLTAYNSRYSNNRFIEKRDCKNGLKDSGLRMNRQIAEKEQWGEKELEERSEKLKIQALKIWDRPQYNFNPIQEPLESYTLADDLDLSGKKIANFVYKGIEQPVKNWLDMFEKVLVQLHSENKAILYRLAQDSGNGQVCSSYFSNAPDKLKNSFEIDSELYCQKTTDTPTKLRILIHLFNMFGVDLEEIEFHIKDEVKKEENTFFS